MPKRKRYLDNGGKPDKKTVYKAKYTGKIYNTAREAAIDNTRYLREPINRFDAKSKEYPRYKELNIPFIEEKRRTFSNAGLATGAVISENLLDSIAKYANIEGLPLKTALGLVTKESTLGNPTDDKSVYKLLGEDKALFFKRGGGGQFINKEGQDVDARGLVNYYKDTWNPYEEAIKIAKIKATGSNGVFVKPVNWGNDDNPNYLEALNEYNKQKAIFDKTLIEGEKYADRQAEKKRSSIRGNVLQAAFRDYKTNPNGYNPGQRNYPQLVERRGNEVWNSPEIQNWYKRRNNKRNGGRISLRNGGRLQFGGGGKSSFVRSLESQPTILEQIAGYIAPVSSGQLPEIVVKPTNDANWLFSLGEYSHNGRKPLADSYTRKVVANYLSRFDNENAKEYNVRISRLAKAISDTNGTQFQKNDRKNKRAYYDVYNDIARIDDMNDVFAELAHPYQSWLGNNKLGDELSEKYDNDKDPRGGTRYAYPDTFEGETHGFFEPALKEWIETGNIGKSLPIINLNLSKEKIVPKNREEVTDSAASWNRQAIDRRILVDPHQLPLNKRIQYGIWNYPLLNKKKADGGTIHIAPSKRGTFTAAATRHGMGVQEFANTVLRNKDRYSPSLVKKANFARNASKWNH